MGYPNTAAQKFHRKANIGRFAFSKTLQVQSKVKWFHQIFYCSDTEYITG